MRKFYLENETGERKGLNGENKIWLTNPAGLGLTQKSNYADIGNGFFSCCQKKLPQQPVTCSFTFTRNAYSAYESFVDWCMDAQRIFLVYAPGPTEYYREIDLDYLTKGELTSTRWLEVPAALKCLTPWYLPVPTEVAMATADADKPRKRYSYRYTADLRYGGDAAGAMSARIKANGHIPGAVLLRFRGGITDPRVRLTGAASGKVYGICALTASLAPSEELELSTLYEDSHVLKRAADGTEADLVDEVDLSHDPYFHTPTNEDSILTIESAAPFTGTASLLVYGYYRSV